MPRLRSVASYLNVVDELSQEALGLEKQRNRGECPPYRGYRGLCHPLAICVSRASHSKGFGGTPSSKPEPAGPNAHLPLRA